MSQKTTHPATWLLLVSVSAAGYLWTRDPDIAEIMDRGFRNGLAAKVAAGDARRLNRKNWTHFWVPCSEQLQVEVT